MDTGLTGRVALIAGASQGIGRAIAQALAAEGCHLALCARNQTSLDSLASDLRMRFGIEVETRSLDLKDCGATRQFVETAARRFERLDICVPNAGGPPAKPFLETTDEDWDSAFTLNLKSTIVLARAVIPHMRKRKWGRIIAISSITVRQPQPGLILSNAVRGGIPGLLRSLANEFGPDGILVNNVGPGYTATDRLKELTKVSAAKTGQSKDQIESGWTEQIPLRRLGQPEEIADAVVWLASERASFVTGQTILVDGGMYQGL